MAVPPASTLNTASSLLDHVTVPGNAAPRWSLMIARNTTVSLSDVSVAEEGSTVTEVGRAGSGGGGGEGCTGSSPQAEIHAAPAKLARARISTRR